MINRIKIAYIFLLIFIVGVFLIFFIVKNNKSRKISHSNLVAIMLETEPGIYTKSQSNNWPSNNEYVFNSEKSYCLHGGTIIWNGNNISFNTNGADKCFAYFKKIENVSEDLKNKILDLNGGVESIKAKGIPNFNSPATTNEGMFATQDDHGTSYYFRGAIDNNWVKFGKEDGNDIWWRIVRINGDDSVKLIYTGTTAPTEEEKVVMTGSGTQTETSAFNTLSNRAEYIGYMYTLNEHRGHSTNSTTKTTLDTWYTNNLSDYEKYLSDFVVCNDRGFENNWVPLELPTSGSHNSNAHSRNYPSSGTSTPSLICPNQDDAYTKNDNIKGNAKLTNQIGLLTADEVTLTGAYKATSNNAYYLYTRQNYWLVSPDYVNLYYATEFCVGSHGGLGDYSVTNTFGVRPVISLSSDLSVSGSGQWNDPYIPILD